MENIDIHKAEPLNILLVNLEFLSVSPYRLTFLMGKGKMSSIHKYVKFKEVNLSFLLHIIKVQVIHITFIIPTDTTKTPRMSI
jgi:hypothetical protein